MADNATLASLLARMARADHAALHSLYQAEAERLFGLTNAILRNREAAADALHDAFLRVAERAGQYDPAQGDAAAWLGGLVRYAALEQARRRGRERPSDDLMLGDAALAPEALEKVLAGAERKRLHWCLATLEEKYRRGILLAYVHGVSHAQLSARLHLPMASVRGWIRQGLLTLRDCAP